MNYLAHLFLSHKEEGLLIGNFIADSIKNRELDSYSFTIQKGIQLHRQIDAFTDSHPIVKQSTRRLYPHHGKYAAVAIDVFYDYLLAKNWDTYSSQSLPNFAREIYQILLKRQQDLPIRLQRNVLKMIENDWLVQYGTKKGIRFTFEKMEQRTRFTSNFNEAVDNLWKDYALYDAEFNQFFPDVLKMADNFRLMEFPTYQ